MQEFCGKFDAFEGPILEIIKVLDESSVSTGSRRGFLVESSILQL